MARFILLNLLAVPVKNWYRLFVVLFQKILIYFNKVGKNIIQIYNNNRTNIFLLLFYKKGENAKYL